MKCIFIGHKQLKEKSPANRSFRGFYLYPGPKYFNGATRLIINGLIINCVKIVSISQIFVQYL